MQVRSNGSLVTGPPDLIRRFLSQGAEPTSLRTPHETHGRHLGRKPRVLAVLHGYLPFLAAGSERMVQHLLNALPRDEFDVSILSFGVGGDSRKPYAVEGVPVKVGYTPDEEPDIIITHHGSASRVVQDICADYPDARVVAIYHNERYDMRDVLALRAELEIFNTRWVQKSVRPNGGGIVIHPPVEYDRHRVEQTGDAVTFVNLQRDKGVETFAALAERLPDTEFLGVVGSHGHQELRTLNRIDNIRIVQPTQDMREVWRQTRVVLMPSIYESFGMVAAEACVSGIPVVAHPTPGLVECLDDSGTFVHRDNYDEWESTVRTLLTDQDAYRAASGHAGFRGRLLADQTSGELIDFVTAVRGLV